MGASEDSYRLYNCVRCAKQVRICRRCDRGNRYCAEGCAQISRREAQRRAGRSYQRSPRGACNHAARQARLRARHANKVTHQSSPVKATLGIVASIPTTTQGEEHVETAALGPVRPAALYAHASFCFQHRVLALPRCSFCGAVLPQFARRARLRGGP